MPYDKIIARPRKIRYCACMANLDPGVIDLPGLFHNPGMFESRRTWSEAGFVITNRSNCGKIMVAKHSCFPDFLFKKYTNDTSRSDQRKNYERRIAGASRLREFIESRDLLHVVVPKKWLIQLPFSRKEPEHLLVVERLNLLNEDQTEAAYRSISLSVLSNLCTVLYHFRGMDSNDKNLPFTVDGRVAFIDTEHWDRGSSKPYLHQVREHLSTASWKAARRVFSRLEEDEGDRRGDFEDEEDTSSSSSSSS